jgi:hypothetical protein
MDTKPNYLLLSFAIIVIVGLVMALGGGIAVCFPYSAMGLFIEHTVAQDLLLCGLTLSFAFGVYIYLETIT